MDKEKDMDIKDYPQTLKVINNIINNKGIAEVKIEKERKIVVVEVGRAVKHSEERKDA